MRNQIIVDITSLEYGKYRTWKPFMEKYNIQTLCEVGVREGFNFEKMIEQDVMKSKQTFEEFQKNKIAEAEAKEAGPQLRQYEAYLEDMKKLIEAQDIVLHKLAGGKNGRVDQGRVPAIRLPDDRTS